MAVETHTNYDGVTRHVLRGPLSKARGVIGREPAPGEEYVFEFDSVKPRSVHMVGVRSPLQVEFRIVDRGAYDTTLRTTLQPWTGVAKAPCNEIIERGIHE